ncbi:histidine kinase [Streptomyces sp. ACA25]|uniref:sensor histidine kinase n=1 Tax=Streptomyces sp. ACA25 TaxID=3022596 RepID=UPI00230828AE|nr:histidine kinase [Streptomyces sp. ACA25]MDB1086010.1 histidine kinase [Streptomyces sp. ACA25]
MRAYATAAERSAGLKRALAPLDRFLAASGRVRFHQYTRYMIYSFTALEAVLLVIWLLSTRETAGLWAQVTVLVAGGSHTVLNGLLSRAALAHYTGTSGRPDLLLCVFTVGTLGALAVVGGLVGTGALPEEGTLVMVYFPIFFAGPVALALTVRQATALAAVPAAAAVAGTVAVGQPLLPFLLAVVAGAGFFGFTFRCSGWTLRVVDELDATRETQARLAVAEERLRFGRDLHDVLGRNLSVIALKSELAVQLAQRGSPAAVDQMTEVQRIARSSQQEMRAVVRGYREADLQAELAGARGVLTAAGIDCRIDAADGAGPGVNTAGTGAGGAAPELSEPVRSALGWVVREGTTNVLRHADAAHCTIRLHAPGGDRVVLLMENDGARDTRPGAGDGSGLDGLRERLAEVGGTLTSARPGNGSFRLTAEVPVRGGE